MRKNIMKVTTLVLLATMTMTFFAGCGNNDEPKTESFAEVSKTQEDAANNVNTEATKNNADVSKEEDSQEEDSQEVSPFLGPDGLLFASEEDVVINISGVDVPMKSTRDELIALIEENNWEIVYSIGSDYVINSFKTPDGNVNIAISSLKEDGSGEELVTMILYSNQIDLSKVSINGVTLDKVEMLKNDNNTISNLNGALKLNVADNTTLLATYSRGGELGTITLMREQY